MEILDNMFILAFTLSGSEFQSVDTETKKQLDIISVLTMGMKIIELVDRMWLDGLAGLSSECVDESARYLSA